MIIEEEHLAHYGILRRSGRYPWGSGGNVPSRSKKFLDYVKEMRQEGMSDTQIARGVGMSTTEFRAANTIAKNEWKHSQILMAQRLKDKGYSNVAIGERMGLNESSVRSLLSPGAKDKADLLTTTSNMLKEEVDAKGLIDIGSGVENHVGVSKEKLNTAVAMLKEEGYSVHRVKVEQLGTGFETEMKVLVPPGVTQREVWEKRYDIKQVGAFSDNGGRDFTKTQPPLAVDPKRVEVRFKEDGGDKADGVIYVREGVSDVSIGNSRYAQVRIQVGKDRYLKGMAMYSNDLPDGVDLLFNTNKSKALGKAEVMKKIEDDPDLPFGSVVRQITKDGKVTSAMNIVGTKPGSGVEGGWATWSRNLSSQFLSKQSPTIAKTQLDMTYESRKREFDDIMSLTNPTIRKKLLETFSDSTDSAAVHLKAAAMERQNWRVLLPINDMKPTEIYAPTYRDGERVALVRYPHGGTFEIPELTVNNRQRSAKKLLGDARDAVGIHHSVAERLSGADFDGDTVLVIPNNRGAVKTSPALEGLKGFDPQVYKIPEGSGIPKISSRRKQQEMGNVSNLITDMTIRGASHSEIARAVRHSMVVIDSEKHGLNYKQSAIDNGIKQLKEEYQGSARAGASTLISRAGSQVRVPDRKPRPQKDGGPIDLKTGERVYVETGKTSAGGRPKTIRSKKLAETSDANTLVSDANTTMEKLYANHSNKLKSLANQARLASVNTPPLKYSPSAKKAYSKEVAALDAKLSLAQMNRPRERQAQILANAVVQAKRQANPNLDGDTLKKIKYQALEEARTRTGAKKDLISITPEEWNAIQAGAISNSKLTQILNNADLDVVRTLATPRPERVMTNVKTRRAMSMLESGYTRAEVADALGVSVSTLDLATSGDEE